MRKTALLVIDMQHDFCDPDGKLFVGPDAVECIPKVQDAVTAARACNMPVVWIVREHDSRGIDVEKCRTHLYGNGKVGAVLSGSNGVKMMEGLAPLLKQSPTEYVIIKKRFSAFFATHLDLVLRRLDVKHLVISGVQTPNCIRATAYDAVSMDYDVAVLADATASATKEIQSANLFDLKNIGVKIWQEFNECKAVTLLEEAQW